MDQIPNKAENVSMFRERLHILFEASAFIKAASSTAEIILGILFFTLNPQVVNKILFFILGDELTEQPRDPIWNFLFHGFTGLSAGSQHFWAVIFITHGVAIMLLVIGLIEKRLWIYPSAAIIFGCFAIYQICHIIYSPSIILSLFEVFDILFIWLITWEYHYQRHTRVIRTHSESITSATLNSFPTMRGDLSLASTESNQMAKCHQAVTKTAFYYPHFLGVE